MIAELLSIALFSQFLVLLRHGPTTASAIAGCFFLGFSFWHLWRGRARIVASLKTMRGCGIVFLRLARSFTVALFVAGAVGDPWLKIYTLSRIALLVIYVFLTWLIQSLSLDSEEKWLSSLRRPAGYLSFIVVPLFMLYLCNSTILVTSDSRGNGLLPFSLERGKWDLDDFVGAPVVRHDPEGLELTHGELVDLLATPASPPDGLSRLERGYILHTYHLVAHRMHFYNMFPMLPGLANTLVLVGLQSLGFIPEYRTAPPDSSATPLGVPMDNALNLLRITAALQAAIAVAMLLSLFLRRLEVWPSIALSVLYALASFHYSVSSQALWQHGIGEILVIGTILCFDTLVSGSTARLMLTTAIGALVALLIAARPTNVVLSGVLALVVILHDWRNIRGLILGGLPIALLFVALNVIVYDHPLGGYGHWHVELFYEPRKGGTFFGGNPFWGAVGLLFSPGRGFLLYTPYLFAVGYGLSAVRRDPIVLASVLGIVAHTIFFSFIPFWSGGICYGPRYLVEVLPLWMILLIPFAKHWDRLATGWKFLAYMSAVFAFLIQISPILSERPLTSWSLNPHSNVFPERLWQFRDPPFLATFKPYRSFILKCSRFYAVFEGSQRGWTEQDNVRSGESDSGYLRIKQPTDAAGSWIILGMPAYLRSGTYTFAIRARVEAKSGAHAVYNIVLDSENTPLTFDIPADGLFHRIDGVFGIKRSGFKLVSMRVTTPALTALDYIEIERHD